MGAKEAVVCDLDPAIKIGVRIFRSSHSEPAVVCNEVYLVADGDLISDGDKIWLATEGEQVRAEDLHALAYYSASAAEVPDGIVMEPRCAHRQAQNLADHEFSP